jgi:acetoin utilization protein AcuC
VAAPFFYHPRMLAYDFGPRHPLKPERLRRAIALLESYGVRPQDPGPGSQDDARRIHDRAYIEAVGRIGQGLGSLACVEERTEWARVGAPFGFGSGDNPPFPGMLEASLAYLAGTVRAAEAVRDGAPLAISLSGGLHHALPAKASGFCIFNDPAVALDVLLEKFDRVAYVDIDLHHGDGVQWIWYEDPRVLTYSIHQDPRTLFPGTGFVEETGTACTSVNVPLEPYTTGETWLWAFEQTALPALKRFRPGAIVLQMGTDAHFSDPLGLLQAAAQDWLAAVRLAQELGVPLVAVGGGGYEITAVPRMWASACLQLMGIPFADEIPEPFASEWGMLAYADSEPPGGRGQEAAERAVKWLRKNVLDRVGEAG